MLRRPSANPTLVSFQQCGTQESVVVKLLMLLGWIYRNWEEVLFISGKPKLWVINTMAQPGRPQCLWAISTNAVVILKSLFFIHQLTIITINHFNYESHANSHCSWFLGLHSILFQYPNGTIAHGHIVRHAVWSKANGLKRRLTTFVLLELTGELAGGFRRLRSKKRMFMFHHTDASF